MKKNRLSVLLVCLIATAAVITSLFTVPVFAAEPVVFEFNGDNSEGWTVMSERSTSEVKNGNMVLGFDNVYLWMNVAGLSYKTADYAKVAIKIKNESTADYIRFLVSTTNGNMYDNSYFMDQAIETNSTEYKEYIIDLSSLGNWSGDITELRFDLGTDVLGTLPDGTASLDYIKLVGSDYGDSTATPESKGQYDFENGSCCGWTPNSENTTMKSENGSLVLDFNEVYVWMTSGGLNLPTEDHPKMLVRIKNESGADYIRVWVSTSNAGMYDNNYFVELPIESNSSEFKNYEVDLTSLCNWEGTIKDLRFDIGETDKNPTGKVSIDYIKLAGSSDVPDSGSEDTSDTPDSGSDESTDTPDTPDTSDILLPAAIVTAAAACCIIVSRKHR